MNLPQERVDVGIDPYKPYPPLIDPVGTGIARPYNFAPTSIDTVGAGVAKRHERQ